MRCMFSAALQSLSSHLPGCGAGLALAACPGPCLCPLCRHESILLPSCCCTSTPPSTIGFDGLDAFAVATHKVAG
ncbi:hypothetical protein V8C86DRAFT_2471606 [Haematococcus lacustris]